MSDKGLQGGQKGGKGEPGELGKRVSPQRPKHTVKLTHYKMQHILENECGIYLLSQGKTWKRW